MERVLVLMVLAVSNGWSFAAKHVFVEKQLTWSEAQAYCWKTYTGLSPVTNNPEIQSFRTSVETSESGWVGLFWAGDACGSGGAVLVNLNLFGSYTVDGCDVALLWFQGAFRTVKKDEHHSFFCLNLIVLREQKTWEEALDHCTCNHSHLTSLLSETENLLAKREIQDSAVTERVWIGLRFLGDRWLWVNGDPLQYQAWSPGGDECPAWTRCGALNKQGEWESRDCEERLDFICV